MGDRVKQSLFGILEPTIRGRPFLDLYAGSGAAGIEALSRGATRAVFVDRDRDAVAAIERNLAATWLAGDRADVRRRSVTAWLDAGVAAAAEVARNDHEPFAAIFVDPPYDAPSAVVETLERIARGGRNLFLAADGVLVAKHFWKATLPGRIGLLTSFRQERFGETMLTFYRWEDAAG
jgi:16S rRNA (guanine(966)-N(2))-methyltransferase RsmD